MNKASELRRMLDDHQPFHSEFQMDRFITAQHGGTRYGCYRQALREVRTRFDGLKLDYIAIARAGLKIQNLEDEVGGTAAEMRVRELDLAEARMQLEGLQAQAKDRCREFIRFFDQARALRRDLGELTLARRAQLEQEFWEHHVKAAAAVDWLRGTGLSPGTLEALRSLPIEMRARIWASIRYEARDELMNWWLNYDSELPQLEAPETTPDDVERLLCRSQLLPTSLD